MMVASWGDSDSDAEEMNTKCLMDDDEVKDIFLFDNLFFLAQYNI